MKRPPVLETSRRDLLSAGLAFGALVAGNFPSAAASASKRQEAAAAAERRRILASVRTWGYQLRLLRLSDLAASQTDLLVMDHGLSDGRRFIREFAPWEIEQLKQTPDGRRRRVLAYLSIGEAERYRFYWDPAWDGPSTRPRWLGAENPRWAGNYPVDFWEPAWQALLLGTADSYLQRIVAQGFDGVYLDRADVFQERLDRNPQGARAMAALIARLATEVRASDPTRLVLLQNAEELIRERAVRDAIDAIAKEDLYYGLDHTPTPNDPEAIRAAERDLRTAQRAGKRIFTVEYVTDPVQRADVIERTGRAAYLPVFVPRDLSQTPASTY